MNLQLLIVGAWVCMEKEQCLCIHVLQTLAHQYALILIGQESIKKGCKVLVMRASHYRSHTHRLS